MHDNEKFMIIEGLIFYAFAFALQAHPLLSFFTAVSAVIITLIIHTDVLLERIPHILPVFFLQLVIIQMTHLESMIPYIAILALAALTCADIWLSVCGEKLHTVMNILIVSLTVYLILMMTIDNLPFGKLYTAGITLLVYGPVVYEYVSYEFARISHMPRKNRGRKHITAVE